MKAIVYTEYGPPEVAAVVEVDAPVPTDHEVLVKVHASTVNRTDCGFRSAEYFIVRFFSGLIRPRNQILGCEFAGEIESIGKNVTSFKPGDRVFGFNEAKFGAHAEYMTISEADAIDLIPEGLSYQEAAPLTEGVHYALFNLKAAKIKSGQEILINGGTGGIGSSAIQLAKYFGAEVTAVCHQNHVELVKSLGAHEVIDYTKADFTQLKKKFDIVFDAVGKSSFGKCKPILKDHGIYMSTEFGYMAQNPFLAIITPFLGGKKVLFPLPSIKKEDVSFFKKLVEEGNFRPLIDRTYPMDQIVEAYRYVETGQKIGNVVIQLI